MNFSSEHQDYNRAVNPLLFNTRQTTPDVVVRSRSDEVSRHSLLDNSVRDKTAENNNQLEGGATMNRTIKDMAENYVPKSAKNITELKSIDVALIIQEEKGLDPKTNEEYTYNYVELNGDKYRVPDSVLKDLKSILAKKPSLKTFCVSKSGEGRLTKYTVIPLD